jgi:tetraacyldisaccharide 4'-kinase
MGDSKNILLYPPSVVYGLVTGIRNFLYNNNVLPSEEFHLPIICVGNLTVGGTGKTPHTEYLIDLLREKYKVATLSRGYKRKSRDFRIASEATPVSEIGDEPLQIYRKFPDALVTVDRNRVSGVKKILEEKPETDVIILDDGFQHRRLTPGFSILLTDFDRLIARDHMLPYGNLREDKANMSRADIILITKSPENITPIERRLIVKEIAKAAYQNLYFTSLTYKEPLPVFDNSTVFNSPESGSASIVLVTGIANPVPLKEYLQKSFKEIIHLQFPDHYNFKESDISRIIKTYEEVEEKEKFIFTTEKDAIRINEFTNIEPYKSAFYYIPIGIKFLNNDKDEFDNLIVEYVRKNKRNNRLSEF